LDRCGKSCLHQAPINLFSVTYGTATTAAAAKSRAPATVSTSEATGPTTAAAVCGTATVLEGAAGVTDWLQQVLALQQMLPDLAPGNENHPSL